MGERRVFLKQSIIQCEQLLLEIRRDSMIPRNRLDGRMAEELARIRQEQVVKVERIRRFLLSKI